MIALFAVGVIGIVQGANSAFMMTIDDLATPGVDVIITDDVVTAGEPKLSDGSPGVTGMITYTNGVGAFIVAVTTAISKPILGNASLAMIDVNNISVSGGAGTLRIIVTDTDFSLASQSLYPMRLTNLMGGVTAGEVTTQGWLDPGNAEFGMGTGTQTVGPIGALGPGAFSETAFNLATLPLGSDPFSLTEQIDITHLNAFDNSSFNKELRATATPEPGTLILLGSGLFGLTGYAKLRRKRKKS